MTSSFATGITRRASLLLGAFAFFVSASAFAAAPINTKGGNGFAIKGYDTVAYFTDNKPVKGSDQFVTEWKGAKWKFASQEHLDAFKATPEKYAPQYGGYCAYGVAKDNLVKIEPDQFTVIDGKLYLNYDDDVQKDWKKDVKGYIGKADAKFDKLLKE